MATVDRVNRAYGTMNWRLRQARMFVAFSILGGLVGAGLGLVVGVVLSLAGLPYAAAVSACAVVGLVGLYVGFARWHHRYVGHG